MDKVFLSVLNMSLTGAFIIAAICLARIPLKKAPKIISYALWAIAGIRLVFPFSVESVFSLIPFKAAPIPTDIAMQATPLIDSGIPFVNNAVSGVLPAATPTASVNPLQIWTAISAYVWLAIACIMLIYGIISFIILKRKMSKAAHIEENIYEAAGITSPFVLGIFSPKIYIPAGLSENEREYILLHEQTHIRRRDHIVKLTAYFILCLHWFNPLAWIAFLLMGADMEMSCDERVMKELGNGICDDYSMSLVRIATGRRILNGSPLAFGEGGMKERVKRILNFKKPSRMIIVLAVALVAALSVGFAMNRAVNKPLIEMQMVYEKNPAYWFNDMRLVWDDTTYYVTNVDNAKRGAEIGYAADEVSTWRIFELKGYNREYLYAEESEDVWRVMSIFPPEAPQYQYILENADDNARFTKMLSVSLYSDGRATLYTPPISSYALVGNYFYTFTDSELLIHYESDDVIARFEVIDDNTLVFQSATVPLFADAGARYVLYTTNTQSDVAEQDVAELIERNLDIITEPSPQSDVVSYIIAHQAEYDEIVSLGSDALQYMFSVFEQGGQHGLRGHIMASACRDILGLKFEYDGAIDTGQKWYDAYKQSNAVAFAPDILNQVYLGMTTDEVYGLFGEPDYQASGLMWFGYNGVGVFDPSFSSTGVIERIGLNNGKSWSVYDLVNAVVKQRNANGVTAGAHPTESHIVVSLDADKNGFTVWVASLYQTYIPDGEYNVRLVDGVYKTFEMTFSKNSDYDYKLTSCFEREVDWDIDLKSLEQSCYIDAMYFLVGAIPSDGRYGIGVGTAALTNVAESSTETGFFTIKYFPGATLQIEKWDESWSAYSPQTWIVEYTDPNKNITVGKDGSGVIPITNDLIGIYNVDEDGYMMKFEKYMKPQ